MLCSFVFGIFLFPLWFIGAFSVCISRNSRYGAHLHRELGFGFCVALITNVNASCCPHRNNLGALACGVGALAATIVIIIIFVDSWDTGQPFFMLLDESSYFHL